MFRIEVKFVGSYNDKPKSKDFETSGKFDLLAAVSSDTTVSYYGQNGAPMNIGSTLEAFDKARALSSG